MSFPGASGGYPSIAQDGRFTGAEQHEPGYRRKKLAGYLKAANELRQTYQQSYAQRNGNDTERDRSGHTTSEVFSEAAIVTSGNEEMIVFPSYARRHIKSKPTAVPGTLQESNGYGRDVRDSSGAGDAEFWQQQWKQYDDDNAIVDVDVRGWLYTPHKGPMTRKHRLFVGLARQLVGIPAPSSERTSPSPSVSNSRSTSPARIQRARTGASSSGQEEELVSKDASEGIALDPVLARRSTWSSQSSSMSSAELSIANTHLMARLKPFLASPQAHTPISAFFYNDEVSRQRTITTDSSGLFTIRAALDFIPSHVRILASDKLSATEEVHVTEPKGVSLISDIDDTIKHSGISSGTREIFRNAFTRDLSELTVDGVKEWYTKLADLDVRIHYVSNSPWQIYPVLKSFLGKAGLPAGTVHLKQYSGMLQGIFEPVAERKKSTLETVMRDFPERRFLLVGDSGEADLEVYTDVVIANPGRVLGVFIRDVTTATVKGFFDSSTGSLTGDRYINGARKADVTRNEQNGFSRSGVSENAALKAAIAASLEDVEEAEKRKQAQNSTSRRKESRFENAAIAAEANPKLPRRPNESPLVEAHRQSPIMGDLIDLSDNGVGVSSELSPWLPSTTAAGIQTESRTAKGKPPMKPAKPSALKGTSALKTAVPDRPSTAVGGNQSPPAKPPRTSASASVGSNDAPGSTASFLSQQSDDLLGLGDQIENQGYRATARRKLPATYNSMPLPVAHLNGGPISGSSDSEHPRRPLHSPVTASGTQSSSDTSSRPVPPRRTWSSVPANAAQYASSMVSSYWNGNSQDAGPVQVVNKKEELWRRRWERAQRILAENRVMLRSWRVGSDVMGDAVRLVEKALQENRGTKADDSRKSRR